MFFTPTTCHIFGRQPACRSGNRPFYRSLQHRPLWSHSLQIAAFYEKSGDWMNTPTDRIRTFLCHTILIREVLIKSAAVDGERFFVKTRFEKRGNTVCISRFSNRRIGGKDPSSAVGDLFRGSLEYHSSTQTARSCCLSHLLLGGGRSAERGVSNLRVSCGMVSSGELLLTNVIAYAILEI